MKKFLVVLLIFVPLAASAAAVPKAPTLLAPQIVSPTEIRWRFKNNDKTSVAFELWDVLARRMVLRVDNPGAAYIAETNIVPADPDQACGRYVVAVNAAGVRSFGQVNTYPCVRTPPVPPPQPQIEVVDGRSIKVTASAGANDPATAIGIYEVRRGAWVSPSNIFVANEEMLTPGAWGADIGTTLIGLRPNSSYIFYSRAQSVTGEVSKFSAPVELRMPAEAGDAYAPVLAAIGETGGLLKESLFQTFTTKKQRPTIAGIAAATAVTVDLDDRPYLAVLAGSGEVKSFSFTPSANIGSGLHYLRLGAHRSDGIAWTPTIEFYVQDK